MHRMSCWRRVSPFLGTDIAIKIDWAARGRPLQQRSGDPRESHGPPAQCAPGDEIFCFLLAPTLPSPLTQQARGESLLQRSRDPPGSRAAVVAESFCFLLAPTLPSTPHQKARGYMHHVTQLNHVPLLLQSRYASQHRLSHRVCIYRCRSVFR